MKSMPWLDVFTDATWDGFCDAYRHQRIASSTITAGRKLSSKLGKAFSSGDRGHYSKADGLVLRLPKELIAITTKLHAYNALDKRQRDTLPGRAAALEDVAQAAAAYLLRASYARRKVVAKGTAEYLAHKNTMEYKVAKLERRALRKAAYIRQLQAFLDEDRKGVTSPEGLLRHIVKEAQSDDGLLTLAPGVRLEKLDPWHRTAETNIQRPPKKHRSPEVAEILGDGADADVFADDDSFDWEFVNDPAMMSLAFSTWANMATQMEVPPFFVWLEGHYLCTGVHDWASQHLADLQRMMGTKEGGSVRYEHPDVTGSDGFTVVQPDDVYLLSFKGGCCYGLPLADIGTRSDGRPMDTTDATDSKEREAYAFAWSKGGELFTARHRPGSFHHSSFLAGKKVRCAGMIKIVQGKVKLVTNDSGHYQPTSWHLRRFVEMLVVPGCFAADALIKVGDLDEHGTFLRQALPLAQFLTSRWGRRRPSGEMEPEPVAPPPARAIGTPPKPVGPPPKPPELITLSSAKTAPNLLGKGPTRPKST